MQFVYVMDSMKRVLHDKDTTFAFMRASQTREHTCFHCKPTDLYVLRDEVFARVRPVTVSDLSPHFTLGDPREVRLVDVDAIFIRKDPPFDSTYLYTSLLLERLRGRTLLVNDPRGLREANEKLYALNFTPYIPRTFIGSDLEQILSFVDGIGGKAVIKPLDGAGGSGVMMLSKDDHNARSIIELLTAEGTELVLVQEFLPAVVHGDKRILLLDGEPMGAINRIARSDEFRSNIHVGGRVEPCKLTDAERSMVAAMAPKLRADGLIFVGLDVIGERLTEVNVTSPTGIQQLSQHLGRDAALDVIAWVEAHAKAPS